MTEELEGPIGGGQVIAPNFNVNFNCSSGGGGGSSNGAAASGGRLPEVVDRFRWSSWMLVYVSVVTCTSWSSHA